MPKYVIERELPGAGKLTTDELHGISGKSCDVLRNLGPSIQWVESYVAADKNYGVIFSINGQMHASIAADFFSRGRVKLS